MKNKNVALLLIRITLFAIFMYHGAPKAFNWELAMTKFGNMGFPEFLGPIIGIIEVVGAITLLFGVKNFETNFILGGVILVAIIGVQVPGAIQKGKLLPAGLERDLLILAGHYILVVFGAGDFKLNFCKENICKKAVNA